MSATGTRSPAATRSEERRVGKARGSRGTLTAERELGGVSLGSLKPKSAAVNGYAVSSLVVTVLSVPCGASLTEVTLTVIVLAAWSSIRPADVAGLQSCAFPI